MTERGGICHVCGLGGPLSDFYFVGELEDGWPKVQCANAVNCSQRQLLIDHPEMLAKHLKEFPERHNG